MKDREVRQPFEEKLSALIKKFNADTEIKEKIINELENKISRGDIARIWSGNLQLIRLNDLELLLFSDAFYKALNGSKLAEEINPHNIFTDNEFNEALHISLPQETKKNFMTFNNVIRVYQEKIGWIYHIPIVTPEQIVEMSNNRITNYNFKAQRGAIKKKIFGVEVKIPQIFPEKVDTIAENIVSGKYFPVDTIVINVLKNGCEKLVFTPTLNENIGNLTLYKVEGSSNDEIDGANRIQAINKAYTMAKEQGKTLDIRFKMDIINVDLLTSNDCIIQIDSQTPIGNERREFLDTSKFTKIAKDINIYENEETNILYQRIAEDTKDYNLFNKISTIQVFSEGLEDHYNKLLKQNNPSLYTNILDYIVDFFNQFLGNYFDYVQNIIDTRKKTVFFDINMFYLYIDISKRLFSLYQQDEKDWRKKVKEIANFFDFDKKNKEWKDIRTTGRLTPTAKNIFKEYCDKKMNKLFGKEVK
ncbi:hypothetical protein ACFHWD_03350 [Clostridium sp. MT-14]|uniref:hypothetical protein n=1 Tax=Clostridium sp. MT-14 TaxID=3348360 RepID=UPI0035F351CC